MTFEFHGQFSLKNFSTKIQSITKNKAERMIALTCMQKLFYGNEKKNQQLLLYQRHFALRFSNKGSNMHCFIPLINLPLTIFTKNPPFMQVLPVHASFWCFGTNQINFQLSPTSSHSVLVLFSSTKVLKFCKVHRWKLSF